MFYAFFIPYFYIQIYGTFRGVDPGIANYLLAILNAMNVPSRILPGIVADKYGTCVTIHATPSVVAETPWY